MNRFLDFVIIIVINLALIGSGLYIGNPIDENFQYMYIVISFIGILVIAINKIQNKKYGIINNKIDIFMVLLMFSSSIPVIFRTYTSLNDSVYYIFKYFAVFIMYFIAKNIVLRSEKYINYIIVPIIACSVLFVILGIDNLTNENFLWLTNILGIKFPLNLEKRMLSTFGYANVFSGAVGLGFILCIGKYLNGKSPLKCIYAGISFILLSGIILSYSRITLFLLGIALLIYLIIVKNREKRFQIVELCVISGIFSLVFSSIFEKSLINVSYKFIWFELSAFTILTIIIERIVNYNNNKIMKIPNKRICIFTICIAILFIIFIIIGLHLVKPLTIFMDENSSKEVKFKISGIKPNSTYIFDFDIYSKSKTLGINNYIIKVIEENKYDDSIKENKIEFNNYEGNKRLEIHTSDETDEFALVFQNLYLSANNGLTINKVTINGEEFPLDYTYLPNNLVNRIKNISIDSKEITERLIVSKDALNLVKDNWLFGLGGNAWQYRYQEVQSYNYDVREIHCYIMEILLEFGIIGFISVLGIFILFFYNIFKIIKNEDELNEKIMYISIAVGVFFAFTRSLIDFDFTFMYSLIVVYVLIGMISGKTESKKYNIINNIISVIIIGMALVIIYLNLNSVIIDNNLKKANKYDGAYMQQLNIAIEKLPYEYKYRKDKELFMSFEELNTKERIENLLYINRFEPYLPELVEMNYDIINVLVEENNDNLKDALEYYYKFMEKKFELQKYKIDNIVEINEKVYNLARKLETMDNLELNEYAIKFYKLITAHYEKNKEYIENHKKNRVDYVTIDEAKQTLIYIYNQTLINLDKIEN